MTTHRGELRDRILAVIERGAGAPLDDREFDELAHAVFAHQYAGNAAYRAYCDRRGASPATVRSGGEIPAVPTDAFKATALLTGDPEHAVATFRTSGTTAGRQRRGAHHYLDLSLYDHALLRGFEHAVLHDGARLPILSLVPPWEEQRDSSLSYMVSRVVERLGGPGSGWFVSVSGGLRTAPLLAALEHASATGDPVLLVGTSLAFVHLFEALEERAGSLELPEGSRVMDTGGFKGESREVDRQEVLDRFASNLGIAAHHVHNEYGMTELSSQLYAVGDGLHTGPGWLRTTARDPATLRPLGAGEVGILRHHDLANLDSVAALQTADLGRVTESGIELMGRARGSEARGCSIAMDELLSAIGR